MDKHYLVVDDHPLMRAAFCHSLTALDAEARIDTATTFGDARRRLQHDEAFDLIVLDLGLPDVQGMSALEEVRAMRPATPIVVFSAQSDPPTIRRCLDRGASGFIPKTSSPETTMHAVRLIESGGTYVPPEAIRPLEAASPERPIRADEASARSASAIARGVVAPAQPAPSALAAGPVAATPLTPVPLTPVPLTPAPFTPASPLPGHPAASAAGTHARDLGLTERQIDVLRLLLRGLPNKLICRDLSLAEGTVKVHVSAVLRALGARNRTQAVVAANRIRLRLPGEL